MKRLFSIWLFILIANQLLIFGACFAPYCLAAALPHTLAIALLINFVIFKKDKRAFHPAYAPGRTSGETASHAKTTSESLLQNNFEKAPTRIGRLSLRAPALTTAICLALLAVLGLSWKSGLTSTATSETKGTEVISAKGTKGDALAEESRADDEAYRGGPAQDLSRNIDQGDDEFDDNDIETYERLTKHKYRGATHYNKDQQYVVGDVPLNSNRLGENTKSTKREVNNKYKKSTSTPQEYQCTNAVGKVGVGIGRISYENEYSSFLKREVHAGEFVIFKYQGSEKEYWFKVLNCVAL